MPPVQYFFDTYALVARQVGVESYARFADVPVFCHEMNVLEFIAQVLRRGDESLARAQVHAIDPNLVEASPDDLFAAAAFWRAERKASVSYIDALGYTLSQRHGMRFLTGDKAFKGRDGVEYVP